MEELETGYYWCVSKLFSDEPYILFYNSNQECFFNGEKRFYSDEVKVISPRIEEPQEF